MFLGGEAIAVAAGWAFVRHSQRAPAPFVPLARVFVVFAALLTALLPVVWRLVPRSPR